MLLYHYKSLYICSLRAYKLVGCWLQSLRCVQVRLFDSDTHNSQAPKPLVLRCWGDAWGPLNVGVAGPANKTKNCEPWSRTHTLKRECNFILCTGQLYSDASLHSKTFQNLTSFIERSFRSALPALVWYTLSWTSWFLMLSAYHLTWTYSCVSSCMCLFVQVCVSLWRCLSLKGVAW